MRSALADEARPRKAGRPRWGVAGLSLVLVLTLGAWWLLADDPYIAPDRPGVAPDAAPALAGQTLADLEHAVATGDRAAAAALAAPDDGATRRLLAAIVANAERLGVRDLDLRYVDETGPAASTAWQAAVEARWRFAGFDLDPARVEVPFGFATVDGRVSIRAIGAAGGGSATSRTPLWLTGSLAVRRTDETLVLATTAADADRYTALAEQAVPQVRSVLPRWEPRLVVEVPAGGDQLRAALGAEEDAYRSVAAVTISVDGSLAPDAPVHVFVNPDVYEQLEPIGAQVVMTHEATHVATDAAASTAPLWLVEGFADYVALRDVALPPTTTLGQILRQVRRQGPPPALPGPEEFATSARHLGATYEGAWLACVLLAERAGEDALVRFYRSVAGGADVDAALRRGFGLDLRGLTAAWQERLEDLAA